MGRHESFDADIFVLAGGVGSRMRRDTSLAAVNKLLMNIATPAGVTSMLEASLNGLATLNPREITLLTSDRALAQGQDIERAARQWMGKVAGAMTMSFIREQTPLGTGGAVRNALDRKYISDTSDVVVTPSDTKFPFALLRDSLQHYRSTQHHLLWTLTSRPGTEAQNAGKVIVDDSSVIASYEGRIDVPPPTHGYTSVGAVILQSGYYKELFDAHFTLDEPCDLYRDVLPIAIADGEVGYFDIEQPAPDLGTPERYRQFGLQ